MRWDQAQPWLIFAAGIFFFMLAPIPPIVFVFVSKRYRASPPPTPDRDNAEKIKTS